EWKSAAPDRVPPLRRSIDSAQRDQCPRQLHRDRFERTTRRRKAVNHSAGLLLPNEHRALLPNEHGARARTSDAVELPTAWRPTKLASLRVAFPTAIVEAILGQPCAGAQLSATLTSQSVRLVRVASSRIRIRARSAWPGARCAWPAA